MKQHFVKFLSPGTLFSEENIIPIDSWDVETAKNMASSITQRYNAKPYAFKFLTRERSDEMLDSEITEQSNLYYLGGVVKTYSEIEAENDPKNFILLSNMRGNGWDKIIENNNSWKVTRPLNPDDVILD
jgi:hypothetical protein